MSIEFREAFEAMKRALINADGTHWKTTSRETAQKYINILFSMTEN